MEDLAKMVKEILSEEVTASKVQAHQLETGVKLVDELVDRGLVEAPSYRLAPTNSVPSKALFAVF